MEQSKIRILGIAPYDGMRTAMERAAEAYPQIQLDAYTGDLEAGVAIVQQTPPNTYHCVISRGGTAALIRKVTDLPVVDINISVYDVLRTIKLAQNYTSLYAIVGFPSITEPAHTLCSLLEYDLDILTVHSADEVTNTLQRLQEGGYRMVVCDMVTHTVARQLGLDAFLITSGMESLHTAFDQALSISEWYSQQRREIMLLRRITQGQNGRAIMLNSDGTVFYASPNDPPKELLEQLRSHMAEIPTNGTLKFYYTEHDLLYSITAQVFVVDEARRYLFYCIPSRIPLHTNWAGLRSMNRGECEYLFTNSFYSLSGALGALGAEIESLSSVRQPIMISGEPGTGKEQIARHLYLHSSLVNKPLVVVNCALMNEKSWDFLLNHYSSPLNATDNTVYFQNLESIADARVPELLAAIKETGLARRVRLIFSCACREEGIVPDVLRKFTERLGCLSLSLPPLRSRQDEILSLASLYLSSLNLELGKQISGLEPRAIEMLRQYSWPTNYTQFKNILRTLASTTSGAYVTAAQVAELLGRERTLRRPAEPTHAEVRSDRTLDEIVTEVVQQAVAAHNGNRAAAARQLGISRTTLWRYLGRMEGESGK
ncbi:MAG: PrpR N-terminal domain-containing protein [Eubacteriales bacterium]|nr:PrpR N-terminal domain-containing protein [Eubacteriales bacterium]